MDGAIIPDGMALRFTVFSQTENDIWRLNLSILRQHSANSGLPQGNAACYTEKIKAEERCSFVQNDDAGESSIFSAPIQEQLARWEHGFTGQAE